MIDTYHVPDLPHWKKVVKTDLVRSFVRYDKAVTKGSLTLKFTRFLKSNNTPAILRQAFIKNTPQENQKLKVMLEATTTQVIRYSTQVVVFQNESAYLTQFRVVRNHQIEEDKTLIFVHRGERYELDLITSQQIGFDSHIPTFLTGGKEAQQAWTRVMTSLNSSTRKQEKSSRQVSKK